MVEKIMGFVGFFMAMPVAILLYFVTKDPNWLLIGVGTGLASLGWYGIFQ